MKVEVNGKTYCVETLIADNERLRKDVIASAKTNKLVLDSVRAEIAAIVINGQIDEHTMFIRSGEQVKQMALDIIDKYRAEESNKCMQ